MISNSLTNVSPASSFFTVPSAMCSGLSFPLNRQRARSYVSLRLMSRNASAEQLELRIGRKERKLCLPPLLTGSKFIMK